MATAAVLLEFTFVRVGVACRARRKCDSRIARLPIGTGNVTFRARHLLMRARQRKFRLLVIESPFIEPRRLPPEGRVAPRAVRSEAPLMLVLMARGAARLQSHVCVVQVFSMQQSAGPRGHVPRIVASAARYARMLSIQQVTRLRMIESRGRRRPVHDREILSVVIGVALHTRSARAAALRVGCVQAFVLLQFGSDFAMTLET
jgi:hypothetical protein